MPHRTRLRTRLLASLLALPLLVACADGTSPTDPPAQLSGTWVGSYTVTGTDVQFGYTLVFSAGGSMQAVDGLDPDANPVAAGTWRRDGNQVRATYAFAAGGAQYTVEGTIEPATSRLSGTWGAGETATGGGTFDVARQ